MKDLLIFDPLNDARLAAALLTWLSASFTECRILPTSFLACSLNSTCENDIFWMPVGCRFRCFSRLAE